MFPHSAPGPWLRPAIALALAIALAAALAPGIRAAAPGPRAELLARALPVRAAYARLTDGQNPRVLHLKFRQPALVRLRDGRATSLGGDDIAGFQAILGQHPGVRLERLFDAFPEQYFDRLRAHVERVSGREQADFNLWYRLRLPPGTAAEVLLAGLNALPEVEVAYAEPLPAPPPGTGAATPDYTGSQGYLRAGPSGIDALLAWKLPGGTGSRVRIIDIEYSWNTAHEDLSKAPGALIPNGSPVDPFSNTDHGTAVLGVLAADRNSFGVTGIAHGADLGLVNAYNLDGYDLQDSISIAHANLAPGDVMLIEQQTAGPNGGCDADTQQGCVSVEWWPAYYDAIKAAVDGGISVVEAAGNGSQDLGSPAAGYRQPFPDGRADSGAIIVGAGTACSAPRRARVYYSNFGPRVNLQGWGECVMTTGYAQPANAAYTADFSGTSSASAIVASAAALYSSVYQEHHPSGPAPAPRAVRRRLLNTGTRQQLSAPGHIGPLPNLRNALLPFDLQPPRVTSLTLADRTSGSTAFTNAALIDVTVAASDDFGAVATFYLSTRAAAPPPGAPGWSALATQTLALRGVDGTKAVYAWAKDRNGNVSSRFRATILLDRVAPAATLTTPPHVRTARIPVDLRGSDGLSGVVAYLVSTRRAPPAEDDPRWAAARPASLRVRGPDGPRTLHAWVKDAAGNISARVSSTTILDRTAPSVTIDLPADGGQRAALRRIRGTVVEAFGLRRGDFAIGTRLSPDDCAWWDARLEQLLPARCDRPLQLRLPVAGAPNWARPIGRLDAPGDYFLLVRFTDLAGNTRTAEARFRIAPGAGAPPR